MANVSDIISDPSIALLGVPRAPIDANPFTAGQRFAFNNDREREAQSFLQTLAGNNKLRTFMQQRLMEQETQMERLKQLEQLRLTVGAPAAAASVGFESNAFSRNQAQIAQEGQRADVQKVASEAGLAGAQSGQALRQSPESQEITGFNVHTATPLGVQETIASAIAPKIVGFNAAGNQFTRGMSTKEFLESGGVPGAPIAEVGEPNETQLNKFKDIVAKLEGNGNTYEFNVRPDGIMEIIEIEPGGAKEVVFLFDLDGKDASR